MEAQHFQHVVCHLSCKFCCSFASESDLLQLHFAHDFLERVTLKQINHYIQLRRVLLPCFLPVKCLRHPSLNLYESMSHSCIYYEPSYCGTQFSFIFKTPGNYFLSYRIKQQNFLTKVVSFSFVRSSSLVRQLSLACRKRKKIASYSLPIVAVNCTIKLIFVIDQVRERSGNPKQPSQVHLSHSGSQSKHSIYVNFPYRGAVCIFKANPLHQNIWITFTRLRVHGLSLGHPLFVQRLRNCSATVCTRGHLFPWQEKNS